MAQISVGLDDVPDSVLQLLGLGKATFSLPIPEDTFNRLRLQGRGRSLVVYFDGEDPSCHRYKSNLAD